MSLQQLGQVIWPHDRIDKTKKLRLLTKKSGWKGSATRLFELQRKIYGNNGTSVKVVLFFRMEYHKIPKISPGPYIFQRPLLRGLFWGGLIFGGAYLWREICVSKSIGLAL